MQLRVKSVFHRFLCNSYENKFEDFYSEEVVKNIFFLKKIVKNSGIANKTGFLQELNLSSKSWN